MLRITFGGPGLDGFAAGGRDQSLSLFLPHPGQQEPVVPIDGNGDWFAAWRALPEDVRAVMRSYTVRTQRRTPDGSTEIDIDFALHEDGGPACRWVAGCRPRRSPQGARTGRRGQHGRPLPASSGHRLGADMGRRDGAACRVRGPGVAATGMRARVWLEVQHTEDRQALNTAARARISWLVRDEGAPSAVDAVRAAELPEGNGYVWIAGESSNVRALRRHLVQERQFDRRRITFVGYWRRGLSEEQLRAEAATEDA